MPRERMVFVVKKATTFFRVFLLPAFCLLAAAAVGGAFSISQLPPFPLESNTDLFALGEVFDGGASQTESFSVTVASEAPLVLFGNTRCTGSQLDPFLVRTVLPKGTLALPVSNEDPTRSLDVTLGGTGITARSLSFVSGDVRKETTLTWDFGARSYGTFPAFLAVSSDTVSPDTDAARLPFVMTLLRRPDLFEVGFAVGNVEPSRFRTYTFGPADQAIPLRVLAAPNDRLWVRLRNWGTNTVNVEGSELVRNRYLFGEASADVPHIFPGFGALLRSFRFVGMTVSPDLHLTGVGGYRLDVTYDISLDVVPYTPLFTPLAMGSATLQAISTDIPQGLDEVVLLTNIGPVTFEEVHPLYVPSVRNVFKAFQFSISVDQTIPPGKYPGLPFLVSWEFSSADLLTVWDAATIADFEASMETVQDQTTAIFEKIHLFKHFEEGAVNLVNLAGNSWRNFFEAGYDATTGRFTITFRLLLVDSPDEAVVALDDGGIGYLIIYDGAYDGLLLDPLCLALSSGGLPPPVPTGSGDGEGGGCSLGFIPAGWVLLLIPLGILAHRRKSIRRN
jgi:Synergist-CTERM protein sorting domain-containing protein